MTERLYNQDVYTKTFTATVRSCQEASGRDGYEVILDRTAFFPEGGGQYGDIGWLSGIRVTDTQEKDGEVIHYTEEPLEAGSTIDGEIDWKIRFSRMQQHTAEHILSGLVHKRFGYQNVGFHLGDDLCTMDFNGPVTKEQMEEIEQEANRAVTRISRFRFSIRPKKNWKEWSTEARLKSTVRCALSGSRGMTGVPAALPMSALPEKSDRSK